MLHDVRTLCQELGQCTASCQAVWLHRSDAFGASDMHADLFVICLHLQTLMLLLTQASA